ncbi:hypothetical protein KKF91_17895 [Myxococcota bacterium]|nr:hypothetical protein [Myxococcota bacterium]MBU1432414.1 hypothetical protein [Myxococcota bacterium]MBU1900342.1 hypothetical protein [Myxococcota bacterium]
MREHIIAARLSTAPPVEALKALGFDAAAAAVADGADLMTILARERVLSGAYRAALTAESPEAVEAIASAAGRLDLYRRRVTLTARAAIVNAVGVIVALFGGAHVALPALQAAIAQSMKGEPLPALWVRLAPLYDARVGLFGLALLLALWRLADKLWLISPPGRRAARAAAAQMLAALLTAGVSLEIALRRLAETLPTLASGLLSGARHLEAGGAMEEALRRAGVADAEGAPLWALTTTTPGLARLLGDVAALEGQLYAPQRVVWLLYALIIGPLTLGFGYILFTAWIRALPF